MSKQEDIEEGIYKHIKNTLTMCGQNPITVEALALDTTQDIWEELHSQGVVVKIDKELPDRVYITDLDRDIELEISGHTQMDMIRAGYVAVEPLIKEVSNG